MGAPRCGEPPPMPARSAPEAALAAHAGGAREGEGGRRPCSPVKKAARPGKADPASSPPPQAASSLSTTSSSPLRRPPCRPRAGKDGDQPRPCAPVRMRKAGPPRWRDLLPAATHPPTRICAGGIGWLGRVAETADTASSRPPARICYGHRLLAALGRRMAVALTPCSNPRDAGWGRRICGDRLSCGEEEAGWPGAREAAGAELGRWRDEQGEEVVALSKGERK
jgi:hypothetical protein